MPTTLLTHIDWLVTMDDARREIRDGALMIRDHVIVAVGTTDELTAPYQPQPDRTIDLRGRIVLPGLVNTHHHMFQNLTRVVAQDQELFGWLKTLYPIWGRLTPEAITVSTQLALAELILSGCTTTSDHLYLFPNGVTLEHEIEAAGAVGVRFVAARGSMSVGETKGGLPPDWLVEDEDVILHSTRALIEKYHDARPHAMMQIAVAPCSPFSVSQHLMRASAELARAYGVRLHTHLAETPGDVAYSLEKFGALPGDYAQDVGWVGSDVWHAHCVCLNDREIALFGRTGTGVCHCPGSNLRLASGIAPIKKMRDQGVPVGLGVDGSASNDGANLLGEARLAMLLQRAGGDPSAFSARAALELATRGGAAVLGRDDIGALVPGMAADLIAFRLDDIAFAGTIHDPVAALIFCSAPRIDFSIIHGRVMVSSGALTALDLPTLIEHHNRIARQLIRGD